VSPLTRSQAESLLTSLAPVTAPLSSCSDCQLESMAVGTSRQLQVDAPSVSLNLLVATLTTFDRAIDLPIDVSTHPYLSYRVPVSTDWVGH
jgi:hypothetical protein